ncbi:MAG TPA: hypothetical protein VHY09_05845 [Candidatus Methylacidiphilales bacterium]|nr:hypothetical protein [Candidatus Methylacidiphilales bacterium]
MKAMRGVTLGLLVAFCFSVRADEPVNLAGSPPGPQLDLDEAHGRLDIAYVLVPEAKMAAFADAFGPNSAAPDLDAILKQTGGKVVASASTSLVLGGDGAMLEIADSRLTLRPRATSPTLFHLDGRLTRATFSSTFDVLLTPGQYQLFLMWNQPPHGGSKDPYNAVVAHMREIVMEGPNGEVHSLTVAPSPEPEPGPVPPLPAPVRGRITPAPLPLPKTGQILYENNGNTTGFETKYAEPNFTVRDHMLVANDPASGCRPDATGWMAIPAWLTGDYRIDFDVRADANDAMSWLMLFDDTSHKGIFVCNRTNTSFGDPSLSIVRLDDVTLYGQIFNHPASAALAEANAQKFPDQAWTHVSICKIGNRLIDNVGGQILTAEIPKGALPAKVHVGLGYYATRNVGGNGQMAYANIRMIPQP